MKINRYGMPLLLVMALTLNLAVTPLLAAAQRNVVPRDTILKLILDDRLSTENTNPGDWFTARLAEDLRRNGRVFIERGAIVEGRVTRVEKPKRLAGLQGTASLTLSFDRLRTDDRVYPMVATLVSVHDPVEGLEPDDVKSNDQKVGDEGEIEAERNTTEIITKGAIGVAAGALLGALFGNVSRGLLLGSIGGAIAILAPKGKHVVLEEGTGLRVRLDRDLSPVVT
jgi:hypothetical protein